MKEQCWFCKEEKAIKGSGEPKVALAYGHPYPTATLTISGSVQGDSIDKIIWFLCEDCGKAILRTIADSKVASIENVKKEQLQGA